MEIKFSCTAELRPSYFFSIAIKRGCAVLVIKNRVTARMGMVIRKTDTRLLLILKAIIVAPISMTGERTSIRMHI